MFGYPLEIQIYQVLNDLLLSLMTTLMPLRSISKNPNWKLIPFSQYSINWFVPNLVPKSTLKVKSWEGILQSWSYHLSPKWRYCTSIFIYKYPTKRERERRASLESYQVFTFSNECSQTYLGEAILTAIVLINWMSSQALGFKSPLDVLSKVFP